MASHRRPKQPSRARVTVLSATAAAAVALTSQAAQADPKPSKDDVKEKVDKLYHEAEAATERHSGAEEKEKKLEKQVEAIQDKVARGQEELNELRTGLGSMASAQYRSGGIDPSLQLFLSSDPDDYLDKASVLDQMGGKQVAALEKIQGKQRGLAQQRQEASLKLADLEDTRVELAKKKKEVQTKLNAAQKLLNTLTADERRQISQEDADRAARGNERVNLGNESASSGRAAAALSAAATQIGKPYISGAEGPNSYDCSGLTQWAYAQAGVALTRTTYTQVNDGVKIGRSQLAPGDLVFFSGLSHVGLYAGNGQVLHAPKPGTVVRYEAMEWAGSFQFGVRV
ncbi:NlpC/P60 family protein [Streptomyces sp. NBC_01498]|uniref:C40 family peptidase n=1 Tax=Streptomyces sp. NBC_01498 TaxID=2975870 RepID=UPI002E7BFA13|nr:NlpC/P60 family protein [Streptomyces sp. NBC_01498]WTL27284.1 NlpC/P60 family protein [Streptomyces sp. NBC_01498]